jgi:DNA-binding LacI/PurR family transcriptional regulator
MLVSEFQFRWLIRRDVSSILPMLGVDQDNLIALLRQRNVIGIVLVEEQTQRNVGVVIYALQKMEISIVHFGCDSQYADIFFPAMVERMTNKLSEQRRTKLHVHVPEHDISSQIRLSEHGFLGSQVDDLVVMSYYLHQQFDYNEDDHYYGHQ